MDSFAKTSSKAVEDDRTGLTVPVLRRACADNLYYVQGKFPAIATKNDLYMALAYTVRDRLLHRWINTLETYLKEKEHELKLVCYFSAEFLLGPRLGNGLINLGIYDQVRQAMEESGLDLKELLEQEAEPGLGERGIGTPCRLLYGLPINSGNSCNRLRHPPRIRHLHSGDSGWLAD